MENEGGRKEAGVLQGICLSDCFVVLWRHVSCSFMSGMNGRFSGVNGAVFIDVNFRLSARISVQCVPASSAVCLVGAVPLRVFDLRPDFLWWGRPCSDDWCATGIGQLG